jgi:hypothetical protein
MCRLLWTVVSTFVAVVSTLVALLFWWVVMPLVPVAVFGGLLMLVLALRMMAVAMEHGMARGRALDQTEAIKRVDICWANIHSLTL